MPTRNSLNRGKRNSWMVPARLDCEAGAEPAHRRSMPLAALAWRRQSLLIHLCRYAGVRKPLRDESRQIGPKIAGEFIGLLARPQLRSFIAELGTIRLKVFDPVGVAEFHAARFRRLQSHAGPQGNGLPFVVRDHCFDTRLSPQSSRRLTGRERNAKDRLTGETRTCGCIGFNAPFCLLLAPLSDCFCR